MERATSSRVSCDGSPSSFLFKSLGVETTGKLLFPPISAPTEEEERAEGGGMGFFEVPDRSKVEVRGGFLESAGGLTTFSCEAISFPIYL